MKRLVSGLTVMVLIASAAMASAGQGLGEAAAREKKRRAAKSAAGKDKPAKTFTDEDLQKYVAERPIEASVEEGSAQSGSDGSAGETVAPPSRATTSATTSTTVDQKRAVLESIDTQIRACKVRLAAAEQAVKTAEQVAPHVEGTSDLARDREEVRRLQEAAIKTARTRAELVRGECSALEDRERALRR